MEKKKGFVLIETIVVMCILAVGLLSLYASYILIVRKTSSSNTSPLDTYIAYQINNYKYYSPSADAYYTEVYKDNLEYLKRDCYLNGCRVGSSVSQEEANIYDNLSIEKIYYFNKSLSEIYRDVILLFDGSTISYLDSIVNDLDVSDDVKHTVIVKTKSNQRVEFSFYQEKDGLNSYYLRNIIVNQNLNSTIDDYGLSYYYSGNVTNNYLKFAGKNFRIVRVLGNGNIKIVLDNDEDSESTKFNSLSNSNSYVGYMYGNANSADYGLAQANTHDSAILSALKEWYDTNLNDNEKSMIVDTIWCNDKSLLSGSGYKSEETYYKAYERISSDNPSLVCGGLSNNISRFTINSEKGNGMLGRYKIGLLTVDEAYFAGLRSTNSDSYLNGNWWTMSPSHFDNNAYAFAIDGGNIVSREVTREYPLRVSVVLNSNVKVSGSGQINDPYLVIE